VMAATDRYSDRVCFGLMWSPRVRRQRKLA
jgi:hypothetical protein